MVFSIGSVLRSWMILLISVCGCWQTAPLVKRDGGVTDDTTGPTGGELGDGPREPVKWQTVRAGNQFTCGLSKEGYLYCWGRGTPNCDPPDERFAQLSEGSSHMCGIKADGAVYCFGSSVDVPDGTVLQMVSVGEDQTCGLTQDGEMKCWADYEQAPIINEGRWSDVSVGGEIFCGIPEGGGLGCAGEDAGDPVLASVTSVSCSKSRCCGLTDFGDIQCWGEVQISFEADTPFVDVSLGGNTVCGLGADGSVTCYGDLPSPPNNDFTQISVGQDHACGVIESDEIVCWGDNQYGQCVAAINRRFADVIVGGHASVNQGYVGSWFTCLHELNGNFLCYGDDEYDWNPDPDEGLVSLSTGGAHWCGLTAQGVVRCAGNDHWGQSTPADARFQEVAAGGQHTCGVTLDGDLRCWGDDKWGETQPPNESLHGLSSGLGITCGLRSDGSVVCWGLDDSYKFSASSALYRQISINIGQFCGVTLDGEIRCKHTIEDESVMSGDEFIQVSVGESFGCGLTEEGEIQCFGTTKLPRQLEGVFQTLSCSGDNCCALRDNGKVACWGDMARGL